MNTGIAKAVLALGISMGMVAVTAVAGNAAPVPANSTVKSVQGPLTASGYIEFLRVKASTDSAAAENLRIFTSWSAERQGEAIAKFNDPTFQQALVGGTPAQRKAQGISESTSELPAGKTRTVTPMSTSYNVRASYVHEIRSFGLLLFSLRQDFSYQTGSGVVLNTQSCQHAASQYYPLGYVNGSTSHFLIGGGRGMCRTLWTYELNYGVGRIQASSYQELTVNGPGVVSRVFYDV